MDAEAAAACVARWRPALTDTLKDAPIRTQHFPSMLPEGARSFALDVTP
jgi:hypothetical protein